ncbi:Leucine-rich repeat-containing protein 43 [Amphibalanus amphitrite]|uniref:Leucine-rich repeat-containing protein 43 n=1 Tax=Amphibalanus amphitrite TaxID=1232801 RepID=A0A6A4WCN4_AMPAM|nr:Leucine-rich repeat-containing protein 43 [Amphibalanus amphitrite]
MAVETGLLEAPSSVELLHVPKEITARIRLGTLIKTSLITEFPVNRFSPEARQLTTDEAAELLLSAGSPWRRYVWWSADVLPLLQRAVSEDQQVTHRYLLARLQSLSLPRQNISSLGEQMCALSHLSSCSLACNDLTEVQGHDLPRSLRSLQLYGNRLAAGLTALLTRCPPLEYLGLGRTQLTDDHLPELGALLSSNLPSLRVLDLSDNHICDLSRITELVTIASSIRSISLSGNPAFLASGYYQHFTSGLGRLLLLDGVLLTDELLADLQRQLEPAEEPEESASKKKKSGKKSPARKGSRRPTVQLDAVRFEPSLTGALVRVTGAVYLPFMPKDQLFVEDNEVWKNPKPSSTRLCRPIHIQAVKETVDVIRTEERLIKGQIAQLRPTVVTLSNGAVLTVSHTFHLTMIDVPPTRPILRQRRRRAAASSDDDRLAAFARDLSDSWYSDLPPKLDAGGVSTSNANKKSTFIRLFSHRYPGQELCVVFQWAGDRRCPSPFSPPSAQAGGPSSETDRSDGLCPLEALLQEKSDVTALDTPLEWHCTDLSALRNALLHCLHVEVFRRESAEGGADHPDGPPPEYSLGSVLLPVRALLRPAKQLLLQGTTSSGGTTAAVTETTWMVVIKHRTEVLGRLPDLQLLS